MCKELLGRNRYRTLLCTKVKLEIDSEDEREIIIKKILNGSVSKRITTDSLKELNVYDDLYDFFKDVKRINNGEAPESL